MNLNCSFNFLTFLFLVTKIFCQFALIDSPKKSNQFESTCPIRIASPSVLANSEDIHWGASGVINSSSYNFEDESFKCQMIFIGSASERIQITFLHFNLYSRPVHHDNETFRCEEMDHISAHVLIGTRMSRIDDFCGSETPPRLMSTKNLMILDYVIRSNKHIRQMVSSSDAFGFTIRYNFLTDLGLSDMKAERNLDHTCYYIFNSSRQTSGGVFSPNHPGYYPRNINCQYIFHGTENQVVSIHFEYFDVEGFSTCDDSTHSDYVSFSNYQTHDRTNKRFCGQTCPKYSVVSESNYFRMVFVSNDIFDATGFYAHYQFIVRQASQINRVKITNKGNTIMNSFIYFFYVLTHILYISQF